MIQAVGRGIYKKMRRKMKKIREKRLLFSFRYVKIANADYQRKNP